MNTICHVNDDNFNSIIKNNKVTIVDFWATWCGPCKALSPFIDRLCEEYSNNSNILFCKSNIEESQLAADSLSIQTVPCVVFFKDGVEFNRVIGNNQSKIKEIIDSLLNN